MESLTRDEVINRMLEVLKYCEPQTLADLHNQIMTKPVTYRKDLSVPVSMFELQE